MYKSTRNIRRGGVGLGGSQETGPGIFGWRYMKKVLGNNDISMTAMVFMDRLWKDIGWEGNSGIGETQSHYLITTEEGGGGSK